MKIWGTDRLSERPWIKAFKKSAPQKTSNAKRGKLLKELCLLLFIVNKVFFKHNAKVH